MEEKAATSQREKSIFKKTRDHYIAGAQRLGRLTPAVASGLGTVRRTIARGGLISGSGGSYNLWRLQIAA